MAIQPRYARVLAIISAVYVTALLFAVRPGPAAPAPGYQFSPRPGTVLNQVIFHIPVAVAWFYDASADMMEVYFGGDHEVESSGKTLAQHDNTAVQLSIAKSADHSVLVSLAQSCAALAPGIKVIGYHGVPLSKPSDFKIMLTDQANSAFFCRNYIFKW